VRTKASSPVYYLTVATVLEIHTEAIGQFGGSTGIRDTALLESAVSAPQASFGGEPVYSDLVEIAAAYLFFLCRNQPFIDGNKRAALGAYIFFVRLNGVDPQPDGQTWEDLTLEVAASKLDRGQATQRLRALLEANPA
jgi:death on curing protein